MSTGSNMQKIIPQKPEQTFRVPEGYFENVREKVLDRIKAEEQPRPRRKKIYLQPYLTLAAAITGVAIVVYIVLQSVMGSRENSYYDLATLDKLGIVQDESLIMENLELEDEASEYSEWDQEAITYLASNEVDLMNLLESE